MTLDPTFSSQTETYEATLEQPANVVEAFNLSAWTRTGQTVKYSIGSGTTANMDAKIITVGANKAVQIGQGGLEEGDTGTVVVLATVSHENTYLKKTYTVTIDVTMTAEENIDVEVSGG